MSTPIADAEQPQSRLEAMRARGERPIRFAIAGTINTIFGFAIYPVLLLAWPTLEKHYLWGLAIAQPSGLVFAYTTYKLLVFNTRGNILAEFARFSSFYLLNYAVNWLALPALVELAHIRPIYAQIGFALAAMIGSYFWHSRFTFRQRAEG